MRTAAPFPGADQTAASPPHSAVRSAMDRRSPSRAGSTRSRSKPAPWSRTVTSRRHRTSASPAAAVWRTRSQAWRFPRAPRRSTVPLGSRSRSPLARAGTAATTSPAIPGGPPARGRACRRRRPAPRWPGRRTHARRRPPDLLGRRARPLSGRRPDGTGSLPRPVIGADPGQGGERVEDRVVQQALMLAALDVPGQDGVLFAGGMGGRVQGGIGRLGPAVEFPPPKVCTSPTTIKIIVAPASVLKSVTGSMTAPTQYAAGATSVSSRASEPGAYHAGNELPRHADTSQLNASSRTLGGTHPWAVSASAT